MDTGTVEPEDYKGQLARLKNEKGRLGRLVKEARESGGSADGLVAELNSVSYELKTLQKTAKEQLNGASLKQKWTPPKLAPPVAIANKTIPGPIAVVVCDAKVSSQAEVYVDAHPAASLWHRPVIASFVETTYGHPTRYFVATTECGQPVGVLPIVHINSRLFGSYMVSMPYFNYGGILADSAQIAGELIKAAESWRGKEAAEHIELRSIHGVGLNLPKRTNKVSFWLPLPETSHELWDSFKPKLRAQIRRGERELSEFLVGGSELLEEFYRVFATNMRDLGTPVYSRDFFGNLLQSLPGQAWIAVVRINGRSVGAAFLTGYRGRMEIPWASTLKGYSHTGINMIMYWKILEYAIQLGFKVFDFGRCTENTGTYKFKQQWGAQRIGLHWDYVLPAGARLPALNPDNPKFRLLIAIWRRLPLWLANRLGPRIVRMLP